MKVNLSQLFDNPGAHLDLSCKVDLGEVMRWGSRLFSAPVAVDGCAENRSGIVTLRYTADFTLEGVCDRCLTVLTNHKRLEFSHIMVLSLNRADNDEFIVVSNGQLDLAELVTADILLDIPTSMVCDPGCKGLCPTCGKNMNLGGCGCDHQVHDPRLEKLRQLLKDHDA